MSDIIRKVSGTVINDTICSIGNVYGAVLSGSTRIMSPNLTLTALSNKSTENNVLYINSTTGVISKGVVSGGTGGVTSFTGLTDTPNYYTAGGIVAVNSGATALIYAQTDGYIIQNMYDLISGTSFIGLTDTPKTYQAGKLIIINSGATALEYIDTNLTIVNDIIDDLTTVSGITYSNQAQIDAVDLTLLESLDSTTIPIIQDRLDNLDTLIYKNENISQGYTTQIIVATGITSLIFSEIKTYYTHNGTIKYVGNTTVNNTATTIGKFESVVPTDYTMKYCTGSNNLYMNFTGSTGTSGTGVLVVRTINIY